MKRFLTFAIAAALAAGITHSAWSQGGQTGGAKTSDGTGTSDTAETAGTPGTADAAGRTQLEARQNQAGANLQPQRQLGGQARGFDQLNRIPWFNDPGARQQLNLNNNQFNQLTRAYQDAYARYNQGVTGLNNTLTEQQRMQRLQQLQARFNQDLGTTLDTTLTDPQLRQRYSQLNWQFQGPMAFHDPGIQRQLNLTSDQQHQMRRLAADWRRQLNELQRLTGSDPGLTQQQWNAFRVQYRDRLGTILTPAQRQTWTQLIGRPHDFQMEAYLRAGADPTSAADVNPIIQNEAIQRAQQNNPSNQPQGTLR
jgi:hypothetical protein